MHLSANPSGPERTCCVGLGHDRVLSHPVHLATLTHSHTHRRRNPEFISRPVRFPALPYTRPCVHLTHFSPKTARAAHCIVSSVTISRDLVVSSPKVKLRLIRYMPVLGSWLRLSCSAPRTFSAHRDETTQFITARFALRIVYAVGEVDVRCVAPGLCESIVDAASTSQ